jgi:Family of unknown function (DUF6099)
MGREVVELDAVHLIKATRHALAECRTVQDIVAEVWQAQVLAEAVGSHLAASGPQLVRADALGLSEAVGRARRAAGDGFALPRARTRASLLSGVQDPRLALSDLGRLLAETAEALVVVAVSADEETLYWQCIEAIEAADESGDRVSGILRRLELQEHGGVV